VVVPRRLPHSVQVSISFPPANNQNLQASASCYAHPDYLLPCHLHQYFSSSPRFGLEDLKLVFEYWVVADRRLLDPVQVNIFLQTHTRNLTGL
jgi:hypothetical protein